MTFENTDVKQLFVQDLIKQQWDVAVVGAGPAGSLAALNLAAKGLRTILIDKMRFPREKICGDSLLEDALNVLKRTDLIKEVESKGHFCGKVVSYSPSRIRNEIPGKFMVLKRRVFDTITVKGALAKGAVFCRGEVVDFEIESDGSVAISFKNCPENLRAKSAVFAVGANLKIMKKHGLVNQKVLYGSGINCYITSTEKIDDFIIAFDKALWPSHAWIHPLGNGEYNVGLGVIYDQADRCNVNLKEKYDIFCQEFPEMKKLLKGLQQQTQLSGAQSISNLKGANPVGPGNVLLIGEAIGTSYSFTGQGIGKAMESGEMAAECIGRAFAENDFTILKNFESFIRDKIGFRYKGYAVTGKWLSCHWLHDFMAGRMGKSKYLQDKFIGLLNETIDPRELFSIKGILGTLLG